MTATIYCIVALVGDTQPVWLIDFDIVHHHVGDVFDVSVINPFVIRHLTPVSYTHLDVYK
ncbi:hypothetical protein AZ022_005232 [Klebsiella pneumoniae]|nr:hypothetical protein AZ022_005232 [Klebsiella pneumoniae]